MNRSALIAKVHIAKKELGLDDDTYRAVLERVTGHTSSAKCSDAQLADVLAHFKAEGFKPRSTARSTRAKPAGDRPLADSPHAGKIRALWITLYELGVIADSSETALAGFVRRQAKVEALQWLSPDQAPRVIEALKRWATREAGVDWSPYRVIKSWHAGRGIASDESRPKLRVIEAQWRRLAALGAVRGDSPALRDAWVGKAVKSPCAIGLGNLSDDQADGIIRALGRKLRAALEKAAARKEA